MAVLSRPLFMLRFCLTLFCVLLAAPVAASAASPWTLTENGEARATIVVADEPLAAMKRLGVPGLNGYGQRRDNVELFSATWPSGCRHGCSAAAALNCPSSPPRKHPMKAR